MTKQYTISSLSAKQLVRTVSCVSLVCTDSCLARVLPAAILATPATLMDMNIQYSQVNDTIEGSVEDTINPHEFRLS